MQTIFTIGYAAKTIDSFVAALKKNGVTSIVDVRTSPASSAYNRDALMSAPKDRKKVLAALTNIELDHIFCMEGE